MRVDAVADIGGYARRVNASMDVGVGAAVGMDIGVDAGAIVGVGMNVDESERDAFFKRCLEAEMR